MRSSRTLRPWAAEAQGGAPYPYHQAQPPYMQAYNAQQTGSLLLALVPQGGEWSALLVLAAIVFVTTHRYVQEPLIKTFPRLYTNAELRAASTAAIVAAAFHIARVQMLSAS